MIRDFFEKTGKVAIGSRLRLLTDTITRNADEIYKLYGVDIKPKWFPVFYSLMDEQPKSITSIAKEIGHTHPSVSVIAKEMLGKGIVVELDDKSDKRRSTITLSELGKEMAETLVAQLRDVERAVNELSNESEYDLWNAIADWERLLGEKSMYERVKEVKAKREKSEIKIVKYDDSYHNAFKMLNREWIEKFWKLEPHDIEVLENPDKHILNKGGQIFVAVYRGKAVGVCALCRMPEHSGYDYELVKLAVSSDTRRLGIGLNLCRTALNYASSQGAKTIFLESNTRLKSAIALYRKLGFKELKEYHPAYERGDIQMEFKID